jgi:1-acyl-sn-glycerol-3-phosphate acyltransferase
MISLVLLPFSKKKFRLLNRTFANSWWGSIVYLMEHLYHMDFVLTGDDLPVEENAITFSNHQGMIDITTLMPLAWRNNRLGDLKFFVKDILKYVPGPGWGMLFLDCLFVKREWHSDKEMIDRTFSTFVNEHVPIWLVSFLEGTRISEEKKEASQRFAIKRGLKPLHNVLIPRSKGFIGSVIGLRSHVDAVYDITIGYPYGVPTLWQLMRGFPRKFCVHVERFPIKEIPQTEEKINEWLMGRFEKKDELMSYFHKYQKFPQA